MSHKWKWKSDNRANSVQLLLQLPNGTELGNILSDAVTLKEFILYYLLILQAPKSIWPTFFDFFYIILDYFGCYGHMAIMVKMAIMTILTIITTSTIIITIARYGCSKNRLDFRTSKPPEIFFSKKKLEKNWQTTFPPLRLNTKTAITPYKRPHKESENRLASRFSSSSGVHTQPLPSHILIQLFQKK